MQVLAANIQVSKQTGFMGRLENAQKVRNITGRGKLANESRIEGDGSDEFTYFGHFQDDL